MYDSVYLFLLFVILLVSAYGGWKVGEIVLWKHQIIRARKEGLLPRDWLRQHLENKNAYLAAQLESEREEREVIKRSMNYFLSTYADIDHPDGQSRRTFIGEMQTQIDRL